MCKPAQRPPRQAAVDHGRAAPRADFRARAVAGLAFALLLFAAAPSHAATRDLLLAVEVNGRPLELVVAATERDGMLSIARNDLQALGLRVPADVRGGGIAPDGQVVLQSLEGVAIHIDEGRQMLQISARDAAVLPHQVGMPLPEQEGAPDPASLGAILNYDLFASAGAARSLMGLVDARVSAEPGTMSSSFLAQVPTSRGRRLTRLDSSFTHVEYGEGRVWQIGDLVSGGLSWTRPVRLGGVQVRTSFAMRPDLITYPIPTLTGRAAVPSSIDVLVNGIRQLSEDLPSGPFTVRQLPTATGAGQMSVVARDMFGQQTIQTVPFYVSPRLLAEGLSAYSVEAGVLRRDYAQPSDRYFGTVGSLSFRHGLRDWLTIEGHGEASHGIQMAGAGVSMNVFDLGILTMAGAASRAEARGGRGDLGSQYSIGFDHVGQVIHVAASFTAASAGFRDVAAGADDPVPRQVARVSAGASLGGFGAIQASFVGTRGGLLPYYQGALPALMVGSAAIVSIGYTHPVGTRASFNISAFQDLAQRRASGVLFGISMVLGEARSFSASSSHLGGRTSAAFDASQAASAIGDLGLRAHLSSERQSDQSVEASYIAQAATARAGVSMAGRQRSARAELQGTLAFGDGHLFAANRIEDSYAVVSTQGVAGVPVLLENRVIGRTDASGRLLVPGLRGWDTNRLSIDPTGLPADIDTGAVAKAVRPPERSGVVVEFPMAKGASAVIRVLDGAGQSIPVGTPVKLRRTGRPLIFGFDGEVFASGLQSEEELVIMLPAGECLAHFGFRAIPGDIPVIGPVECRREAAP